MWMMFHIFGPKIESLPPSRSETNFHHWSCCVSQKISFGRCQYLKNQSHKTTVLAADHVFKTLAKRVSESEDGRFDELQDKLAAINVNFTVKSMEEDVHIH